MAQSAEVASLQALIDWKASLCTFTAEAQEALSAEFMEVQRILVWLEEQLKYWTGMVRQCEEEVIQAKIELARWRLMRIGGRPPDTTEQERALRRAQERLAEAEEKQENTRHWLRQLPDDVNDFEGPVRLLATLLDADMPKADVLLESKIASLEAYLQITGGGP